MLTHYLNLRYYLHYEKIMIPGKIVTGMTDMITPFLYRKLRQTTLRALVRVPDIYMVFKSDVYSNFPKFHNSAY